VPEWVRSAGRAQIAQEGAGDNRSGMPPDGLGSTRNTMRLRESEQEAARGTAACKGGTNEEFLVGAAHLAAANGSL